MKRYIVFSLYIFCLLVLSSVSNGQSLKGKRIKLIPEEYVYPKGNVNINLLSGKTTKNRWIVYSDRNNNKSFGNINGTDGKNKNINFLDRFCVLEVNQQYGRLHIVKYDERYFEFSKRSKSWIINTDEDIDYGWIDQDKLLLSNHSLVDNLNITIKCLSVSPNTALNNIENYISKEGGIKLYTTPITDNTGFVRQDKEVRTFEFLFVYKITDKAQLIGISEQIDSGDPKNNILGWVDNSVVQQWPTRVCLEPRKDPVAVKERISNNIRASVFKSKEDALQFYQGKSNIKSIWNGDSLYKSYPSEFIRFPILENNNDGIIKSGFITPPYNKKGDAISSVDEYNQFIKQCNLQGDYIRQINIMFVLDGNEEMKGFLPSVIHAIQNCNTFIANSNTSNKYSYGSVIYRNDNCSKNYEINREGLTGDSTSVINFLNDKINNNPCSGKNDNTAMYDGLIRALTAFQGHEKENNLVILIGGKGSKSNSAKASEVIKLMVQYKCGLLAFQADNGSLSSYDDFNDQVRFIVNKSSAQITANVNEQLGKDFKELVSPKWIPDPNAYFSTSKLDFPSTSIVSGYLTRANSGESFKSEILESNIYSALVDFNNSTNELVNNWRDNVTGKTTIEYDAALLQMISDRLKNTPEKERMTVIKLFLEKKYRFFIDGYAVIKTEKLKEPLFDYVLYVTSDEYYELKEKLNKLNICLNCPPNEKRNKLYDTYISILKNIYGKESENALEQRSIESLVEALVGKIPGKEHSELLQKKIGDIKKPKKLDDTELNKLVNYINSKLEAIKKIETRDDSRFNSYDRIYYWIPVALLP